MESRPIMIAAGTVLLGGLIFGAYKYSQDIDKQDKGKSAAGSTSGNLPAIAVKNASDTTDDAGMAVPSDAGAASDKLSITNGTKEGGKGGEVVLELKGDKWVMTKPVEAPANQDYVTQALNDMKNWKVDKALDLKLDDAGLEANQLDPAHAVHVVAWKGGEKQTDVTFGKQAGIGQLAFLGDKTDQFYKVSNYSSYRFMHDVKDWRDRAIFKFDDANASNVAIANKNGKLVFSKGATGWAGTFQATNKKAEAPAVAIPRFDEEKVKNLLAAMKMLFADDFGDGKSAADTGVDAPEGTITVALTGKDKAETYTLKVGKALAADATPKDDHYAVKEGDPTVFVISKTMAEWALADQDKFEKAAVSDAGAPDAAPAAVLPKPKQK